jgi:hypothetical protein
MRNGGRVMLSVWEFTQAPVPVLVSAGCYGAGLFPMNVTSRPWMGAGPEVLQEEWPAWAFFMIGVFGSDS